MENFFQAKTIRTTIQQRHHIDAKYRLELCLLVQVIQHDFSHFATAQLNHQAHTVLIGLVTNRGNAFDLAVFDKLGNLHLQRGFVDLIRQFSGNNCLPAAIADVFKMTTCAQVNFATSRGISAVNA